MKICCCLAFLFTILSASAIPWKYSAFWDRNSFPELPGNQVNRMIADDGGLLIAGDSGIVLYQFRDGKYHRTAERKFDGLLDAVRLGDEIILIDRDGLGVWNPAKDQFRRTGRMKNLSRSYNLPMFAVSEKARKVLVAAQNALYEFDPRTLAILNRKIPMRGAKAALTALPDGSVAVYNMEKLYRYDGKFAELPLPKDFRQSEAFHLGCSADGRHLYFGSPLSAYELKTGKIVRTMPELRGIRWGYAADTRRNELYVASWRDVSVLSNADDPRKWTEINRLGSTGEPPLYTHRDVAPATCAGSLCYLPESDELLFSARPGVTILGVKPHTSGLFQKHRWKPFLAQNSTIPGNTLLHQALRRRKMIASWVTSSHDVSEEALDNLQKSGTNTIIHMVFQIDHGRFYPPHDVRKTVMETGRRCAARGITYLVTLTPYNISINNSKRVFRKFILPDGSGGYHTSPTRNPKFTVRDFPCYLDKEYSEKAGIRHNMTEFAKIAKQAHIAGIVFELGDGITPTNIRNHHQCYCDFCFHEYLKSTGADVPNLAPNARASYLRKIGKSADYVKWYTRQLAQLCAEGAAAMRQIAPEMAAAVMLPETASDYTGIWLYTAFISGFQLKGTPVPVFSEQTYALPYMPELNNMLEKKWLAKGLETVLIPGQVNYWVPPLELARRVKVYLDYTPGVFYFHNYRWYNSRRKEAFYRPMNPEFQPGAYTVGEYMDLPNPLAD